jgi:hypothetical protein
MQTNGDEQQDGDWVKTASVPHSCQKQRRLPMRKIINFFGPLVLLCMLIGATSATVGYFARPRITVGPEVKPSFLQEPRAQQARERVWRHLNWRMSGTPYTGPDASPAIVKFAADGKLAVLDWNDFLIRIFSKDGKLLNTLGKGRGFTEGELANPTDFSVANDGSIWICDSMHRNIIHLDPKGGVSSIPMTIGADRIAIVGQEIAVKLPPNSEQLFGTLDASGKLLRSWGGPLIVDQVHEGLALDGLVDTAGPDGRTLLFLSRHLSFIVAYRDGGLQYIRETIDGLPLPTLTHTLDSRSGDRWKVNAQTNHVVGMSTFQGHLFVMGSVMIDGLQRGVLDSYGAEDGKYEWSAELPVLPTWAAISGQVLASAAGNSVSLWQFTDR